MAWTLPDSSRTEAAMGHADGADTMPDPGKSAILFDGMSSRRRMVAIAFEEQLGISEAGTVIARWTYADVRRVDSPSGLLRVACLSARALARLEIRDAALASELVARCGRLDENSPDGRGVQRWGDNRARARMS